MLCKKFGITHEILLKYEKTALATYPKNAYRFEKSYVERKCSEAKLCDGHRKMILDFMDLAEKDEDIIKFMWLYYYFQFETEECLWTSFGKTAWAGFLCRRFVKLFRRVH